MPEIYFHKAIDMSLLDWFATFAPEPNKEDMNFERMLDMNRINRNSEYKARTDMQISCELRYRWAKEMLKTRQ